MSDGGVLRVAVIGDSTSFTDATGPLPPDADVLWPNVMARELSARTSREVSVTVWARPGVDALAAWQALTKDRHVMFSVVGPADVVVVAIGSFDHAPAGLPPVLDTLVPHLRPAGLRRRVRSAVRKLHPHVVRLRGGRGLRTPAAEFARRYGQVLDQARGLTMGRAVCVALGPTSHRARHHGGTHPRRAESEARQLALARAHGYEAVPVWEHIAPFADRLNADGVHWPAEAHAAVGRAAAGAVAAAALRALRQKEMGEPLADAFEQFEPVGHGGDGSDVGESPLMALRRAAYRRSLVEREVLESVRRARDAGASWTTIGTELGTTGEAARQRYGSRLA